MPLSLAVGFAMIASYLLSSTFVPVLSVWLLRHHQQPHESRGRAGSRLSGFATLMPGSLRRDCCAALGRGPGLPGLAAALLIWLVGRLAGHGDLSPRSTPGSSSCGCRRRPARASNSTEEIACEALDVIKKKSGPDNVAISVGYVGLIPSSYPINTVYLWTGGPEEAVLRVALKPNSGVRVEDAEARLARETAGRMLRSWLRRMARRRRSCRRQGGTTGARAADCRSSRPTSSTRS